MHGVLFDLDGTLLDIDLSGFFDRYFSALSELFLRIEPTLKANTLASSLQDATAAMMRSHAGVLNQSVFNETFFQRTTIDLFAYEEQLAKFYDNDFAALGDGYKPRPGARAAVESALRLGLEVVIATNPVFPQAAVRQRLRWAGLSDLPLQAVTSYENMTACKPFPEYFRQAAALGGLNPRDCMMVGDDRALDLPAADIGMLTFYVGAESDVAADFSGDIATLADDLLPRLAGL